MSEEIKDITQEPKEIKPVNRKKIVTSEDRLTQAANKNDIQEIKQVTANPKDEYKRKMLEPVTGVFRNYENPGGTLNFTARMFEHYRPRKYSLVDGHEYTLPRGIIIHLSQNCAIPVHQSLTDEKGMTRHEVRQLNYRFGFESSEFRGENFRPRIERVESPKIIKPVFI